MNTDYDYITTTIKTICSDINLSYASDNDGRLISAIKEKEYLDLLEKKLLEKDSTFVIVRPKDRFWYDIRINNIPINLKITTGGTDNAFNKVAIIYTISGTEIETKNMNYNKWFKLLMDSKHKKIRDPKTEYHYLVINKNDNKFLLKSIIDIHSFKTNPSNDLQINWTNEFKNIDHKTTDTDFLKKIKEIIKSVQSSVKQAIAGMKEFAESDIDMMFLEKETSNLLISTPEPANKTKTISKPKSNVV